MRDSFCHPRGSGISACANDCALQCRLENSYVLRSLSIGRVWGIDLRINASWLLAFAFVTWGLGGGYFRFVIPRQQGPVLPLVFGAIAALLLFGSVLIHELSHSLVAKARRSEERRVGKERRSRWW